MRIGIVGGGSIVKEFLPLCGELKIDAVSIFTRRFEAGRAIADEYNINKVCKSYDELLSGDDIDFVYIAVPNHLHYDFAQKALNAGKNVILEKPFTDSAEHTGQLCRLAIEKKLYLFEAVSNLYSPVLRGVEDRIGGLGDILSVKLRYMQRSRRYDDFRNGIIHPVFDPTMCGGVLMDLGVYCMHLLAYLFGRPNKAEYMPVIERGIDIEGKAVLSFDGFEAECEFSKASDGECGILIEGSKGFVKSSAKPNVLDEAEVEANGVKSTFCGSSGAKRLCYEWQEFERIYTAKDYDEMQRMLDVTMTVSKVIDMMRA